MKKLSFAIILNTLIVMNGFGQNLISNSSFETGGQLNCQSWYDFCGKELTYFCDTITPDTTCNAWFSQDSPANGETWYLKLRANMPPWEGATDTYITGQSDSNIYQLDYWMKSPDWLGMVSIGIISQNQFTVSKSRSDTTSTWKKFTLTDTISTQATDTIAIRLSAGIGDFCNCTSYFDLLELSIIDTLTSIAQSNPQNTKGVHVFPNPARESITIEIKDDNSENHRFTLYNTTGQVIKTIDTSHPTLTCESRDIATGLYYYQVINITGNEMVGRGKLIIE